MCIACNDRLTPSVAWEYSGHIAAVCFDNNHAYQSASFCWCIEQRQIFGAILAKQNMDCYIYDSCECFSVFWLRHKAIPSVCARHMPSCSPVGRIPSHSTPTNSWWSSEQASRADMQKGWNWSTYLSPCCFCFRNTPCMQSNKILYIGRVSPIISFPATEF